MSAAGAASDSRAVVLGLAALGAIAMGLVLLAVASPIVDPDCWWVAAAGRHTLAHGPPRTNLFSFTAPDHPWVMHEWLLGPLYALLLSTFGDLGMTALVLGIALCGWALLAHATLGASRRAEVALLLCALCLPALLHLGVPRPTVLARLFPLAMVILALDARFDRRFAVVAVLLELVWANAHGSFPLGVVLLGAAAALAVEQKDVPRAKMLAVTAIAAALVTLLNPYGLGLHRLVLGYGAGSDPTTALIHDSILEFRPLHRAWLAMHLELEVATLAVLVLLAIVCLVKRAEWTRPLLVLAVIGLALLQARHVMLALMITPALLVGPLDALTLKRWPAPRPVSQGAGLRLALVPAVLGGVLGLAAVMRAPSTAIDATIGGSALPAAVAALPDGARVHAPFEWAGRVIWLGAPRGIAVAYDSRNDCYPPEVMRRALTIDDARNGPEGTLSLLRDEGSDVVLTTHGDALAHVLEGSGAFTASPSLGVVATYRR